MFENSKMHILMGHASDTWVQMSDTWLKLGISYTSMRCIRKLDCAEGHSEFTQNIGTLWKLWNEVLQITHNNATKYFFNTFKQISGDIITFCGAIDAYILSFWWCLSCNSKAKLIPSIHYLHVMDSSDLLLAWHLPTSWWPARKLNPLPTYFLKEWRAQTWHLLCGKSGC